MGTDCVRRFSMKEVIKIFKQLQDASGKKDKVRKNQDNEIG